jgi:hypothetical protein
MTEVEKKFLKLCRELKPHIVPHKTNLKKIRIGEPGDGGYVVCELPGYDCLYSYGSDDNIKFERGFYDLYGKDCYVYDHTIDGITNKPDYIHFFKEGVSSQKTHEVDTIDNHIIKNGHTDKTNLFMQMDIEGHEWHSLLACNYLKNFSQLVIEFHISNNNFFGFYENILETFKRLNNEFVCVHIHGNNCLLQPWFDHNLPRTFECTYVRKDLVGEYEIDMRAYPLDGLDEPNSNDRPDLPLNWWITESVLKDV